jgi:hypothetical protein
MCLILVTFAPLAATLQRDRTALRGFGQDVAGKIPGIWQQSAQ